MKITNPGVYSGIPSEEYHSVGITPEPALSSTGAKTLIDRSPAHYKWDVIDGNRKRSNLFDIGNAAHLLVLEPERFHDAIVRVEGYTKDGKPSPGYMSADAKAQRDAAYAAGKVPLLGLASDSGGMSEYDYVMAMRNAVFAHPIARMAFVGGMPEQSYFCRDKETGVWLKARLDYALTGHPSISDLKTTVSANPKIFGRSIWDYGYYVSAAHYMDVVKEVTGDCPKRFFFVVVEKSPPFNVSVIELNAEAIEWGRIKMRKAIRIFAKCLETNTWPGYADNEWVTLGLPSFAIRQLEEAYESGEFA